MDFKEDIEQLIDLAIDEDVGSADVTTNACVPESAMVSGRFILRQAGVLAGLPFLETFFHKMDPEIKVSLLVEEGSFHKAGTIFAKVSGKARGIMTVERAALNFIQHASGVATLANKYVRKAVGTDCMILDTRKTLPGLRALEKYAVGVGGGINHRYHLDDRFVIKHHHRCFSTSPTPIKDAVQKAKEANPTLPIEIEITDLENLQEALETPAEIIMLSRMTPRVIKECVRQIHDAGKKAYLESLGTITLDTIRAYAETGVDGIAIGSITDSAEGVDMRMRLTT